MYFKYVNVHWPPPPFQVCKKPISLCQYQVLKYMTLTLKKSNLQSINFCTFDIIMGKQLLNKMYFKYVTVHSPPFQVCIKTISLCQYQVMKKWKKFNIESLTFEALISVPSSQLIFRSALREESQQYWKQTFIVIYNIVNQINQNMIWLIYQTN